MEQQVKEPRKSSTMPMVENTGECVVRLSGISWQRFRQLDACLEGIKSLRLTYAAGLLEIMTISSKHERLKTTIGYLLEAYMRENNIKFYGCGGFTLMKEGEFSGEPDESYCIDEDKETPDIVIEVIITSGSINKLEVYKSKQVPEVWFWKAGQLRVFNLTEDHYQEVPCSRFVPELDLDMLLRYTKYQDQYDAVQNFVQTIRGLND